jgi:hypothetical protein
MKFARRPGGTNTITNTNKTLSADGVIGEILNTNNVFTPIAVCHLVNLAASYANSLNHTGFSHYRNLVQIDQMQHERPH